MPQAIGAFGPEADPIRSPVSGPERAVVETRPTAQRQHRERQEDTVAEQSVTRHDSVPDITTVASSPSRPSHAERGADREQRSRDNHNDNSRDNRDATHARNERESGHGDPERLTATAAVDNRMDQDAADGQAGSAGLMTAQQSILDDASAEFVEVIYDDSRPISAGAEAAKRFLDAQEAVNQLQNPDTHHEEDYMVILAAEESSEIAGIPFPYRAAGTIPGLAAEQIAASQGWMENTLNNEVLQQWVPGTIGNVTLIKFSDYIKGALLSKLPPVVQVVGQIGVGTVTGRTTALGIREVTDAGFEAVGADIARPMPGIDKTFHSDNWGQLLGDSVVSTTTGVVTSHLVKAIGLSMLGISTGPVGVAALLLGSAAASKAFVAADNAQDEFWDGINRTVAENIGSGLGIGIDDSDEPPLTDAEIAEWEMALDRLLNGDGPHGGFEVEVEDDELLPDYGADEIILASTEEVEPPVQVSDSNDVATVPIPTKAVVLAEQEPVSESTDAMADLVALVQNPGSADTFVFVQNDRDDGRSVPTEAGSDDLWFFMFEDLHNIRAVNQDDPTEQMLFEDMVPDNYYDDGYVDAKETAALEAVLDEAGYQGSFLTTTTVVVESDYV